MIWDTPFIPEAVPTQHPILRLEFYVLPKHLTPEDRARLATVLVMFAEELEAKGEHLDTARVILSLPA